MLTVNEVVKMENFTIMGNSSSSLATVGSLAKLSCLKFHLVQINGSKTNSRKTRMKCVKRSGRAGGVWSPPADSIKCIRKCIEVPNETWWKVLP